MSTEITPEKEAKRASFVAGFRELADFLEANPTLADGIAESTLSVISHVFRPTAQEFMDRARLLAPEPVFEVKDPYIQVSRGFGPITFMVFARAESIATKVVEVECAEVTKWVYPEGMVIG